MLEKKNIQQLDSQNMLSSIEVLDKQCSDAWSASTQIHFPEHYSEIDRIVLFGMGGSALGIHVIQALLSDQITVPIQIVNDYDIPGTVNERTLAILSSYSGTTEETVNASKTILDKTNKVFVVTTGGDLQQFAEEHNVPAYIFDPQYNPSKQPRMAVGYSIMGICGALSSLGVLSLTDNDIAEATAYIASLHEQHGAEVALDDNAAKQLAQKMHETLPVLVSSEFLEGSTHVFTNQINENAKQFAVRFPIPEMNHHLIEGLVHARESLDRLLFVFITSDLYHERNQLRHKITDQVVQNNNIPSTTLSLQGKNKLHQALELLLIGSYISLYLAILNNLDPSPIPNVNFLKDELKNA